MDDRFSGKGCNAAGDVQLLVAGDYRPGDWRAYGCDLGQSAKRPESGHRRKQCIDEDGSSIHHRLSPANSRLKIKLGAWHQTMPQERKNCKPFDWVGWG